MAQKTTVLAALASALILLGAADPVSAQTARDYVYVVGSSTVYPFSTVVAERFGRNSRFKTPKVESTGSGGGLKLFCDGVGVNHPDIVNSSRLITASEIRTCGGNGVDGIIEVKIGYDGIILANSINSPQLRLTRAELYLALARDIPGDSGSGLVRNPYATWRDIDERLPGLAIEVLGPPPTSGTRDAFVELVMEHGCRETPWIAALEQTDSARFRSICHTVREDRAYIEAGENDNLIVQKLQANPSAFGILGFSFLDQNREKIKAATIDGQQPTFESIGANSYPISRPLFFYVKQAHVGVIPGLYEFLVEFTHERTWGDDGYLSYRGLVPLSAVERNDISSRMASLRSLRVEN